MAQAPIYRFIVVRYGAFDPGALVELAVRESRDDECLAKQLQVANLIVSKTGGDGLELELKDVVAEKHIAEGSRFFCRRMSHEQGQEPVTD